MIDVYFNNITRTDKFEFRIRWLAGQLIIFKFPTLRTLASIFLVIAIVRTSTVIDKAI